MSTTQTSPAVEGKAQKTVFDLNSFEDVKLVKTFTYPAPVADVNEALSRLGNDPAKLLQVINDGLMSESRRQAQDAPDGWLVEDEDGKTVPFSGSVVSEELGKKIDTTVLAIAKLNGYSKDLSPEKKNELKAAARNFIKSNQAMLEAIKAQA